MKRQILAMALLLPVPTIASSSCVPAPPGEIEAARGVLVDFSRRPLASAQIKLYAATQRPRTELWHRTAKALISVSTDSQGAFDFSTITPGTYFLEIKATGLERTLLATFTPRSRDAAHEIRIRLLGVECNAFEVTKN